MGLWIPGFPDQSIHRLRTSAWVIWPHQSKGQSAATSRTYDHAVLCSWMASVAGGSTVAACPTPIGRAGSCKREFVASTIGTISCLETGCDGAIIKLIRSSKAGDGGKKEGFGSLATYKFHIKNEHGKSQRPAREEPRLADRRVTLPAASNRHSRGREHGCDPGSLKRARENSSAPAKPVRPQEICIRVNPIKLASSASRNGRRSRSHRRLRRLRHLHQSQDQVGSVILTKADTQVRTWTTSWILTSTRLRLSIPLCEIFGRDATTRGHAGYPRRNGDSTDVGEIPSKAHRQQPLSAWTVTTFFHQ
ncbi:hypothetical protein IMY05_C2140000500 [Salix suchowensis]|nr:hypothetical protein IMY05_C2140000500 [Salix suchowensis]